MPLLTSSRRSRLVAASTRTSTRCVRSPPTRLISRCSSTRRSLGCSVMSSSPISSRKIVPPLACSKHPHVLRDRAGEATLLVAEQRRFDQLARDRAAVEHHERPAPPLRCVVQRARDHLLAACRVSPVMRHVRSLGATFSRCAKISRIAGELPSSLSKRSFFDSSISTTSSSRLELDVRVARCGTPSPAAGTPRGPADRRRRCRCASSDRAAGRRRRPVQTPRSGSSTPLCPARPGR